MVTVAMVVMVATTDGVIGDSDAAVWLALPRCGRTIQNTAADLIPSTDALRAAKGMAV
jgi:hypothetical protein